MKMSWINREYKLPPPYRKVLATDGEEIFTAIRICIGEKERFIPHPYDPSTDYKEIIYWDFLPEVPWYVYEKLEKRNALA